MKSGLPHLGAAAAVAWAVALPAASPAPFLKEKNDAQELLLSYQLEQRFAKLVEDCAIPKPLKLKKGGDKRTVSTIDADVISALHLETRAPTLYRVVDSNLARVFGYVYPEAEKDEPKFQNQNYLKINYARDRDELLAPGFPELRLASSCGNVIHAAMKSNAGYEFGMGAVKAALDAELDQEREVTFQISNGRFLSPLWEMWSGLNVESPDRGAKKFYASMLFWDWYSVSPRTGTHYLLEYFHGTSLYRQLTRNKRSTAGASAGGRVSVPFFTVEADTSGRISQDESLEIRDFSIYMAKRVADGSQPYDYQPMPSLDDVLRAALDNTDSSYPDEPAGRLVQAGQTKAFHHDVSHLPAGYCNSSLWQVRDTSSATEASKVLAIDGVDPIQSAGRSVCRVRMSYTPSDFPDPDEATLTPHLVSNAEASGKRLQLGLKPIVFSRRLTPILRFSSGTGKPEIVPQTITPPSSKLNWTWSLSLNDDGLYRDLNRIHTSGLELDCPKGVHNGGAVPFTHRWGPDEQSDPRTLQLSASTIFNGAVAADPKFEVCTVKGKIRFVPKDGSKVFTRGVPPNVTALYPVQETP